MTRILYREANHADIPAMAEIRSADWGTVEYWQKRIREYLAQEQHPRDSSLPRIGIVAIYEEKIAGLIAGHLTRRLGCDGEVEWVSVRQEYRGQGIATELLRRLAEWFVSQNARRICVDVEPSNLTARRFYRSTGAVDLKPHWMEWRDIGAVSQRRS